MPMPDLHESIVALGLAFARRMGVERRQRLEGDTAGVRDADRESQDEVGRCLGDVYRCFGPAPEALEEAKWIAAVLQRTLGGRAPRTDWEAGILAQIRQRRRS